MGSYLYERIVPRTHFLVRLNEKFDWDQLTESFKAAYKSGDEGAGRPAYKPSVLVKMLFLSYLYDLSDVRTEQLVQDCLSAKEFVGLEIDERAPDHSTLSVFRSRILKKLKDVPFQTLFDSVLKRASAFGIEFGKVQIVDSVHTMADVDVNEDKHRQDKENKPPRDPDATWGCKGEKTVKLPDGTIEKRKEWFFGYKTHVSLNQKTGLVTSLFSSTGKEADTKYFRPLLMQDERKGFRWKVVAADKGYDDGENFMYCQNPERAIIPAIRVRDTRLKTENKTIREYWEAIVNNPLAKKALSWRYKIEQKFGIVKNWHGFRRCRGPGLGNYSIQAYMTFLVYNMKQTMSLVGA
jgi:IS5 family transposase